MTIDSGKQANSRPLIPDDTPAPSRINNVPVAGGTTPSYSLMDTLPSTGEIAPSGQQQTANGITSTATGNTTVGAATNKALLEILNDDNYDLNALSSTRQPSYHFRLFMTTEHELVTGAGSDDITSLYNTLKSIPNVTIAESGVTAGFNITSVEIDHTIGPGWRNRSSYMSQININLTEPLGSSLVESMMNAGIQLGIQNFGKVWYYLELTFLGYNEDGTINTDPLAGMDLKNGGHWVWQVAIANMEVNMNENGANYKLTCRPYSSLAFEDETCGRVPDVLSVSGGTIQSFCDDFADKLTQTWKERYLGEIYKFKIKVLPLQDDTRDAGAFKLAQGEYDPIRNLSLDAGSGKTPHAQIPAGTTINDVIMFLYCHTEEAQKMMLDTNSAQDTEDAGGGESITYNKKDYRVPIVPMVEADVKVTGYDDITGQYMKEITYYVWGYRSYTVNIAPEQYTKIKDDPGIPVRIANELRKRGYLRKRYEHRFTGMNTEVIRFDLDYNFAFAAVMPKLTGWRAGINEVSDHEKRNPALISNSAMTGSDFPSTTAGPGQPLSDSQLRTKLQQFNTDIDAAKGVVSSETAPPDQKAQANAVIEAANRRKGEIAGQLNTRRSQSLTRQRLQREQIEAQGPVNIYAEDARPDITPDQMTYVQAHDEATNTAGAGFLGQWHRGASLAGAVMNQLYEPVTASLASINLEIRGDPYWIGYSHVERRALLTGGQKHNPDDPLPNFAEGDSTFALILRFPSRINAQDGSPIIRDDDVFNGLYRVTNVKSNFVNGEFKQTLEAIKLELITTIKSSGDNKTSAQPADGAGSSGQS